MKNTGLKRIVQACRYSWAGVKAAFQHEPAFRYESWVALLCLPLAWLLGETWIERAALMASVLLVLLVELINSAIEAVVDRIGREQHELSGRAKDQGSAAVALAICIAIMTWLAILLE